MVNKAKRIWEAIFSPPRPAKVKRMYAAARRQRQHQDWTDAPTSANWETRQSLRALRARAREAARDDPYLSRYLSLIRSNVIGQMGIQLQPNAKKIDGSLDIDLNKTVKDAWELWGRAETCTVSGKLDWIAVQNLVATQVECDGEALVQLIPSGNEFDCSVKVWNVDWLDETYNVRLSGGNRVIMSVEFDDNDKPVAYWLTPPFNEVLFMQQSEQSRLRTRVPADQMIHVFETLDDEAQARGITSFKAVLLAAKKRHTFGLAVVDSARVTSMVIAFLKETVPDDGSWDGNEDKDGNKVSPTINMAPMSFNELLPGQEVQQLDPKQPTQNHSAFMKTLLTEEGAGLGVPYFLYADDWEAVNFSSSRGGLDGFRDKCRRKQRFYSSTLHRRVFHFFMEQAFFAGRFDGTMTAKQYLNSQNPDWKGRGWPYINPQQDVISSMIAIAGGLSTYTKEFAEQGEDFLEILKTKKAEQDQMDAIGVQLTPVTSIKVTDTGTAPAEDSGPAAPAASKTPPKRSFSNGDAELLN